MQKHKIFLFKDNPGIDLNKKFIVSLSMQEINSCLDKLKIEVKKEKASYRNLKKLASVIISEVPIPLFYPPENLPIIRARPNYNGEVFKTKSEVSYNRRHPKKILLSRFNLAKDPVFYGAIKNGYNVPNGLTIITTISESFKALFDESNNERRLYFTVGSWKVQENFPVIMLTFFPKAEEQSEYIKRTNLIYEDFFSKTYNPEDQLKIKLLFSYLSECACKKNDTDNNYLLTTAFFEVMQFYYGKKIGIMYSSSMTENLGTNIVLTKDLIDEKFIELE